MVGPSTVSLKGGNLSTSFGLSSGRRERTGDSSCCERIFMWVCVKFPPARTILILHTLCLLSCVSGVALLVICGHDVLRNIWVTEFLKHIHMSLLVSSFSPRTLQNFCCDPENVPVFCQKNVDASHPLPISSVTPCPSAQEPQLFLRSLSPVSWVCSGNKGV